MAFSLHVLRHATIVPLGQVIPVVFLYNHPVTRHKQAGHEAHVPLAAARVLPPKSTSARLTAPPHPGVCPTRAQPKYIPRFIARQAERDADVVTGSRYIRGGGVAGWDARRKLTSCGANILAATLLQPRVRGTMLAQETACSGVQPSPDADCGQCSFRELSGVSANAP